MVLAKDGIRGLRMEKDPRGDNLNDNLGEIIVDIGDVTNLPLPLVTLSRIDADLDNFLSFKEAWNVLSTTGHKNVKVQPKPSPSELTEIFPPCNLAIPYDTVIMNHLARPKVKYMKFIRTV